MRHIGGAWALLLVATVTVQAAEDDLAQARRWVLEDLRYQRAIRRLDRMLSSGTLSEADRKEALGLLGIARVAQGQEAVAEDVFSELLQLEPEYRLDPLLSPKIHAVFERAQKKAADAPRFVDVLAITEGTQVVFQARLIDPTARVTQVLAFVRGPDATYQSLTMVHTGDVWSIAWPLPPTGRARILYYLEGRSASDNPVTRYGSRRQPSQVVVERTPAPPPPPPLPIVAVESPTPWYGQWWIWTTAAVVVAGAIASAVVLTSSDPEDPTGTLDPIRLD